MGKNLAERVTAGQQSTDVATRDDTDLTVVQQLRHMEAEFANAMPRGGEAKQLIRDAMTSLKATPRLQQCPIPTVLGAAMTCAQLGLRPGVLGHAWILPYWDAKAPRPDGRGDGTYVARLILGYQGLVELCYRSGMVQSIVARTIYEHDEVELAYGGDVDVFRHRPSWRGQRGDAIAYYAVARTTNGGFVIADPMSHEEMEAYRDRHAPRNRADKVVGPWVDEFEGMAHKTMVRRVMKLLPKSTDMAQALAHDEGVRSDYTAAGIDTPPEHPRGESIDAEVVADPQTSPQTVDNAQSDDGRITSDTFDHLVELLDGMGYTDTESRNRWAGRAADATTVARINEAEALKFIEAIQNGDDPGAAEDQP